MPFTFSHPAIVLPLKALKPAWFSTTGLVLGSMAPDFVYFLRMGGNADFGHTLPGIVLLDIPLVFLVGLAFHRWFRNTLIRNLPAPLDGRNSSYLDFDFLARLKRNWFLFLLSSIVGIISHLFWDDFTKPDGFVYYVAPSFFKQQVQIGPLERPLYILIERTGSLVGLLVVLWVIWKRKHPATAFKPFSIKRKVVYWAGVLVTTAIIATAKLLLGKEGDSISYYVLVLTSAGVLAFIFVTLLAHLLHHSQKDR